MARTDNRYSRFVATLKVVLLLCALGILSTLFLLARGPAVPEIPFAETDLRSLVSEQRVEGPSYRGVTADGRAVSVSAETAIPRDQNTDLVDVHQLSARVRSDPSGHTTLQSDGGLLDNVARTARFDGNVRLDTADGYALTTDSLTTAFDGSKASAPGDVQITGPGLELTAGSMEVTNQVSSSPRVVFKHGVRLIYSSQSE